jgi:hypothetical protein
MSVLVKVVKVRLEI